MLENGTRGHFLCSRNIFHKAASCCNDCWDSIRSNDIPIRCLFRAKAFRADASGIYCIRANTRQQWRCTAFSHFQSEHCMRRVHRSNAPIIPSKMHRDRSKSEYAVVIKRCVLCMYVCMYACKGAALSSSRYTLELSWKTLAPT